MPEEFIRLWGNYAVIEKIKIITVKPYSELSLQYFNIPRNLEHRLITENSKVEFLEIATGSVDEDDVIRLEDKYGRTQNRTKCQN